MSETREGLTRRQGRRVAALTGVLAVLAGAAVAGQVTVPRTPRDVIWVVGLMVLFAATEGFVVHIRVRRGAHALGLGDVPTVLGLLAVDPFLVVLAHVVGGFGSLWGIRGQRGSKLRFNMALAGLQGAVGALVFRLCGAHPGPPGPREWFAAYAAVLIADAVAVVAVTAVIALHDDPGEWRRLPDAMRTVPLSAVAATIALIGTHAAQGNAWVLALLGILLVAVHLAYRAFVQQRQGRAEVDQLYAFTRALTGVAKFDDVLMVLLGQVRDQLRAGAAELVVPGTHGVTRYLTVGAHEVSEIHQDACDDPLLREALAGRPGRRDDPGAADALAVPVAIGDTMAALVVVEPLPDSGPFDDDRLHLLEALANHAGVALTKVELVERLLREAAEKEHVALHDSLSGLPNRRHFHTLVTAALAEAAERGMVVAVLVLDIDRFAEVNDALGHGTGDALLVEVADRLRLHVAGRGVVGRIGGDEFAVALSLPPAPTAGPTASPAVEEAAADGAAAAEAEALATAVGRAMHRGPLTLHVRASIGVAFAPRHGTDADALVRHADVAMYAAKRGHTGIQVYDAALDRNTPRRLALIADLRRAVDAGEVRVVFQPKLDPATGTVIGAEALARWSHPEHGAVPPDEFIALAEHSGLIRPLTMHVLTTSLWQRAQWAGGGSGLHVAVNLSPKSLSDAELPEVVARLLAETATPPEALTLEITESTLMVDPEAALANLHNLEALGVKLSIDDFGTGYSSLSRLRTLPIHEVKIDRSFVQRLAVDHRDRALVRSAIQMGHALDLKVVAEGVEDADTAAYLVEAGCDIVQGYYFARPMPPEEFAEWLTGRPTPPVAAVRDPIGPRTTTSTPT